MKASKESEADEGQVSDASLLKQIDQIKMQAMQDKSLVKLQKDENLALKTELAKLAKALDSLAK